MRDILAYRMDDGTEALLALSEMSFELEEHSISSILVHEITTQTTKASNESGLANLLCNILSQQWDRCLREKFVKFPTDKTDVVPSANIYSIPIKLHPPAMLYDMQILPNIFAFATGSRSINNRSTCLTANSS